MPSLLKGMLFVFFLFCFGQNKAQLFKPYASRSSHHLIATNDKKTRRYVDGNDLKIRYYKNGDIIKAKGRLLIDSAGAVEITPYGRKPFAVINTDSIISISRWHRNAKIGLGVALGAGIVLGVLAATSISNAIGTGGVDNALPLLLLITVVGDGYYLIIATPIVFISEWLSIRSEKKGYHFYVE